MIQNLHKELGGDAELDDDEDDGSYILSIKRICERRVTAAEERLKRFTSEKNKKLESQEALLNKTKQERREQALLLVGLQNERKEQTATIEKLRKDRDDSRSEADDAHRGAISIFNEQKKHESHIQRLQAEVHRANSAVEKMRTETVSLRIKNQDVRDDRANLQRLFDSAAADNQRS